MPDPMSPDPEVVALPFTRNQRRAVERRSARVGTLDNGSRAVPVKPGDTEDLVRAIFDAYDPELVLKGAEWVEWCPHTSDYMYRHGCDEWCERPVSKVVWVARYPAAPTEEERQHD